VNLALFASVRARRGPKSRARTGSECFGLKSKEEKLKYMLLIENDHFSLLLLLLFFFRVMLCNFSSISRESCCSRQHGRWTWSTLGYDLISGKLREAAHIPINAAMIYRVMPRQQQTHKVLR